MNIYVLILPFPNHRYPFLSACYNEAVYGSEFLHRRVQRGGMSRELEVFSGWRYLTTERCVVSTLSCWGSPGFHSKPGDGLCPLGFLTFLSHYSQIQMYYFKTDSDQFKFLLYSLHSIQSHPLSSAVW